MKIKKHLFRTKFPAGGTLILLLFPARIMAYFYRKKTMTREDIITATIRFVQHELRTAEGGHDWQHISRVWHNARLIAGNTGSQADLLVVELGALLHDIADAKFHNGDETLGPRKARRFLLELGLGETLVEQVVNIIRHISFKGGNFEQSYRTPELDIVQDADRLDALGAIGIARAFHYGGFANRAIYDPAVAPSLNMSREEYKNSKGPTINHFYEKLLLLSERMNTPAGKALAQQRHDFMLQFLEQFYKETGPEPGVKVSEQ